MSDHDSCKALLREARANAKRNRVTVPRRLTAWINRTGPNPYGEVRDRDGILIWEGRCHCAFNGKALAIRALIAKAGKSA